MVHIRHDTDGYWNLFRIGMQGHRRRRRMPNNTNCSRHCAFKLSGFMDHNNVDVCKSLNLCLDEFQTLNPMRNRLKQRERNK